MGVYSLGHKFFIPSEIGSVGSHWAKKEISYVSYFLKVGISYTNQVEDRAKCPTYMTFSSILYLIGVGNTNFQEVGHIGNFFFRPVSLTIIGVSINVSYPITN